MIANNRVIIDCRFSFLINLIVFHLFKMSYTTGDEIMVEPTSRQSTVVDQVVDLLAQ